MPSHTTSIPSLGVQILRTGFYIYLAVYTLFRTLTLLPRHYKTWPFGRIAIVGLLKHGLLGPSWLPRYSLGPTTGQIIRSWARKNKVAHSQEEIKPIGLNEYPSYILHRLSFSNKDSHDQRPVLLYIHGGAFFRALTAPGHIVMAREIMSRLGGSEAFILEYNLAPDAKYPVQHVQSVSALQHLLKTFPAEQIYIAGDSAGAHLATSILTHLQKPSPYHPPLDLNRGNTREGRLAGAVLISPYVKCNRDKHNVSKSVKSNAKYDYLDHGLDLEVQRIYAPKEGDLWAEPYHAPTGFWTGLKVDRVLVIVGDLEVLRDDAITFGENMKRDTEGESVELVVVDDAIHVEAVIDLSLGYKNGNMLRGIVKWCEGVRAGRR